MYVWDCFDVLMLKIILKNKKTSLTCILARKVIWKAPATTLPNMLLVFIRNASKFIILSIVFWPSLNSKFWSGHWVLTRSSRSIFFKKSKRHRFSKKKIQKSTGCNRVFNRVFPPLVFSSTRPGSNPGSAGTRVDLPGRVLKLWFYP